MLCDVNTDFTQLSLFYVPPQMETYILRFGNSMALVRQTIQQNMLVISHIVCKASDIPNSMQS